MRILYLIARQCNLLLQAKELKASGHDDRTVSSRLGVPPFIAGKCMKQAARFSAAALRRALQQCVESEEAVKRGQMNDVMSVEILIMTVL